MSQDTTSPANPTYQNWLAANEDDLRDMWESMQIVERYEDRHERQSFSVQQLLVFLEDEVPGLLDGLGFLIHQFRNHAGIPASRNLHL